MFVKLQASPDLFVSAQMVLLDSLAVDVATMLGISSWDGDAGDVESGIQVGEFTMTYG